MSTPTSRRRSLVERHGAGLLLAAAAALALFRIGAYPLLGPDEPRYGQVAREMVARGDLVTPTLGGHPWLEKPPLAYWSMAASIRLFGLSEGALRLPSVLAFLVTAAALYAAVRAGHGQRRGLLTAAVATTSIGLWSFAHGATTDMPLTACVTLALGELYPWLSGGTLERRRLIRAGIALGLGLLAKGLIGVLLPLLIAGAALLLARPWRAATRPSPSPRLPSLGSWLVATLAGVAVASVWYVPVTLRLGREFLETFFVAHHFRRYLSEDFRHPGPPWYYLLVILLAALPWTAFLVEELWRSLRAGWRSGRGGLAEGGIALAWTLVPIAFFSLSRSKLPGYVLPALPGAAILIGRCLDRHLEQNRWRAFSPGALLAACVLPAVTLVAPWILDLGHEARHLPAFGAAVLGVAAIGLAMVARSVRATIIAVATVTGVCLALLKLAYLPEAAGRFGNARIARAVAAELRPGERVLGYNWYDHALTFYTDARSLYDDHGDVVILRTPDELRSVIARDPSDLVVTRGAAARELLADARLWVDEICAGAGAGTEVVVLRVTARDAPAKGNGGVHIDPEPGRHRGRDEPG